VKWDTICLPKADGGLGVRDIRITNISLLAKWKWRLLHNEDALWVKVLCIKYGASVVSNKWIELVSPSRFDSLWWKDVRSVGGEVDVNSNWFSSSVSRVVSNGRNTRFWRDKWTSAGPLMLQFPRLFSIASNQDVTISDLGAWLNNVWMWNFSWRRNLFVWEENQLQELIACLRPVANSTVQDSWRWDPVLEGQFSVSSVFSLLVQNWSVANVTRHQHHDVLALIWSSAAPLKVCVFSWQLLLDRVATRANLALRGMVFQDQGQNCLFCNYTLETADHLFVRCHFSSAVWYAILGWLGYSLALPSNIASLCHFVSSLGVNKKINRGLLLIWHASIWVLWNKRNAKLFSGKACQVIEVVDEIKQVAWQWFIHRLAKSPCLFYEWVWNPILCISNYCH
jgi:hypothetical protein